MKQSLSGLLLLTLCVIGMVTWLTSQVFFDLRDWLDSDTWFTTQSTGLTIQPKTSRVTYTYRIDGEEYTGERTHFFVFSLYQDDRHLNWLYTHRRAATVTVYYNPDAPGRSVLVREVDAAFGIQWIVIAGWACLICLLPVIFFGAIWWWLWHRFP